MGEFKSFIGCQNIIDSTQALREKIKREFISVDDVKPSIIKGVE